jgi:hypothetical protein
MDIQARLVRKVTLRPKILNGSIRLILRKVSFDIITQVSNAR